MNKNNRPCRYKTDDNGRIENPDEIKPIRGIDDRPVIASENPLTLNQELNLKSRLLDLSSDAIFLRDLSGRFVYINSAGAELTGFTTQELQDINAFQLDAPEYLNTIHFHRSKLFETGEFTFEAPVHRKDGSIIHVEVRTKIIDINGTQYLFETVRDITNRKTAESALKDSYERLHKTVDGIISTIATMSETRDPYTAGHQRQVSRLAHAIAGELNFDASTCESIRIAGIVHDIGKLAVPAEILSKPGKLSHAEFAIIKRHPEVGSEMLKNIDFPWPICNIILQHHERLDGSGYPAGLKGGDICPEARILAVSDVVEAIASHRPYRPALGIETALDEIIKYKGIKYDTEAVDACVRLINDKGFSFY
jgi:PAS domain S-box-containing protein/putative nucleotidyltransferase with HDIG domain